MKNSWRDINRETQSKKQAATHKKISRKDPKTQLKKYKSDWGDKLQKTKQ